MQPQGFKGNSPTSRHDQPVCTKHEQRLCTKTIHPPQSFLAPTVVCERTWSRSASQATYTSLCLVFLCRLQQGKQAHLFRSTCRVNSRKLQCRNVRCSLAQSQKPRFTHSMYLSTFTTGIRLQAQSLEPGVLASDRFLTSNTTGYTHYFKLVFTISSIRSSRIRVASGSSTPATISTIGALLSSVATMLARAAPSTAQASDLWSWRVRVAFVPSATSPFDPCLGDGVTKSACCEPPEGGLKVLRDGDSAGRVLSLASPV